MVAAGKMHAGVNARAVKLTVLGASVLMAALAGAPAQQAYADPGRAGAPIVYAAAKPGGSTRPASYVQTASIQGPISLRPGAAPVSFGPAPAAAERDDLIPVALLNSRTVMPVERAAPMAALAEPYAGAPYQVEGRWYVPTHEPDYDEVGVASWYGPTFHGKPSATGEIFDEMALTAAHPTLPIPSLVRVTNLDNGKSIVVRLNDRGPFVDDRIIDLSRGSAEALDMRAKGTARVRVQYVGAAPVEPNSTPSGETMFVSAPSAPVSSAQLTRASLPASGNFALAATNLPPLAEVDSRYRTTPAEAPARVRQDDELRGVYLQAGSFSDLGNANNLRDKMSGYGPSFVTPATVNGSVFYRVMLGPWTSRSDAERAQAQMRDSGAKTLVVARLDR